MIEFKAEYNDCQKDVLVVSVEKSKKIITESQIDLILEIVPVVGTVRVIDNAAQLYLAIKIISCFCWF
jgi:hypothetical protein